MIKLWAFIALGGAVGALARYGLAGLVQTGGGTFPWGTLVVNVLGSFALGFLMRYLLGSGVASPELRAALTIGFCGAFTTMSTFSYETVALVNDGQYWLAWAYLAGTFVLCLTAVVGGLATANQLL
ncbi:MAG TPA: fluoride efflux transporter CrcB [Gemmatimonadales bacterium]|jgi:CrcB protein|nr:fluoride efflux transporter CrcB [Gemmatimonadales bacterium]